MTIKKRDLGLIELWIDPQPEDIAADIHQFLDQLNKATAFYFPGKDRTRTRGFVTLLHGNEISGLQVLHRWIKSNETPAVNLLCLLGSVQVAKTEPRYTIRHPAEERDLNRCFAPPYLDDRPGRLAQEILTLLHEHQLECLIDMHNTSGEGPPFAVTTTLDETHIALTLLFSHRLIYTDLRLGALMELGESAFPTITIECGGSKQPQSQQFAWEGFRNYVLREDVLQDHEARSSLKLFNRPVRLEIASDYTLCFGEKPNAENDLTVINHIEQYNFDRVLFADPFAWTRRPGLDGLEVINSSGEDITNKLFRNSNGAILANRPLRLFMATSNPVIAKSDCLFYLVCDNGETL